MVWASIWYGGRSNLVIMERDENSPRTGYTAESYIIALEDGLIPFYRPEEIFQQDNASIHQAKITQLWFEEHGIWVMDWPAHSPDLNPIENIWKALKNKIFELYPKLSLHGCSKIDWTQFHEAIQKAWEALDQGVIDRLIDSMPCRLAAVRQARGWYTKY
jgi:hypothetical protein